MGVCDEWCGCERRVRCCRFLPLEFCCCSQCVILLRRISVLCEMYELTLTTRAWRSEIRPFHIIEFAVVRVRLHGWKLDRTSRWIIDWRTQSSPSKASWEKWDVELCCRGKDVLLFTTGSERDNCGHGEATRLQRYNWFDGAHPTRGTTCR